MNTINIAICEDIPEHTAILRCLIEKSGISCRVFCYEDGESFLQDFRPGFFQLVFFDLYFTEHSLHGPARAITGMEAALKTRETDDSVWIVFTTASPDQAIAGYKVQADRYLTKPLDTEEVASLLHRAAKHWESVKHEITVIVNRRPRSIITGSIIYIEACGKQCAIQTQDETIVTYGAIDELEMMLKSPPFLRCHRGYIVNMDYIESADRDFHMTNGDRVYISRQGQWKMRERYRSYIVRLARGDME